MIVAAEHEVEAGLEPCAANVSGWVSGAEAITGGNEVSAKHAPGDSPGEVHIKTGAKHEAQLVDAVEGLRDQAMVADEGFEEWREVLAAECDLGADGDIVEARVINAGGERSLSAAPMIAVIDLQREPAIEIVGAAESNALRVGLKLAA